ncbi:YozE family protein [Sporosarcina sp. FSL K6-5500]
MIEAEKGDERMDRSFYRFALSFRGGAMDDLKSTFAEYMFKDSSFPKEEKSFDPLSRYIEEKADAKMPSVVFDELFLLYEERFL